jgi:hypothetical protein
MSSIRWHAGLKELKNNRAYVVGEIKIQGNFNFP